LNLWRKRSQITLPKIKSHSRSLKIGLFVAQLVSSKEITSKRVSFSVIQDWEYPFAKTATNFISKVLGVKTTKENSNIVDGVLREVISSVVQMTVVQMPFA
jgi:hypothetical protein